MAAERPETAIPGSDGVLKRRTSSDGLRTYLTAGTIVIGQEMWDHNEGDTQGGRPLSALVDKPPVAPSHATATDELAALHAAGQAG